MHKYQQSEKRKRYLRRRAKRSLRRKLSHKHYVCERNRSQLGKPHFVRIAESKVTALKPWVQRIVAPSNFSFVNNAEEMCLFIQRIEYCLVKRRPVYIVMMGIEKIGYGALAVLLSIMVRFKSTGIDFNGNTPLNPECARVLIRSRFFDYLYKQFDPSDEYELSDENTIVTHARTVVNPELAAKVIEEAGTTIWGEPRRSMGVYRVIEELMHNTHNHAAGFEGEEKFWWMTTEHNKSKRKVLFSFVDYGVGVFKSLEGDAPRSKFKAFKERLVLWLSRGSRENQLQRIFEGDLHLTVTGNAYRGKGLPGIYEAYQKGKIANLCFISNNVMFDGRHGTYTRLKNPFHGTYVYWELTDRSPSLPL